MTIFLYNYHQQVDRHRISWDQEWKDFDILIEDDEEDLDKVKQMAPVTIYKSSQLGISINVEEHDESSDIFQEEARSSNPFKRFTSRDGPERNPETVSLVNSVETSTSGTSGGGRRRQTKKGRSSVVQARIYSFLEHPTGWKCFAYHMGV